MAASFFVYGFVATAKDAEMRRTCTSACVMKPDYAGHNRRAPDFTLKNLKGESVSLSDFRGQVVLLNFWSKSCPPCLEEMPSLALLGHSLSGRDDIKLVTITTDESAEDARATLSALLGPEVPFEVLVDSEAAVVTDLFGTKLFPETWFIDREGVVRARVDGARDWASPLALEFAESLKDPLPCPLKFDRRIPSGPGASLCEELAP